MTLEGEDKKEEGAKPGVTSVTFPLVGTNAGGNDGDDSDDSGSVGDIDDYELEEDDPVSLL